MVAEQEKPTRRKAADVKGRPLLPLATVRLGELARIC
jgi:hypothetical protein